MQILAVDPELVFVPKLEAVLGDLPLDLTRAESTDEALSWVQQRAFDVALIAMNLPAGRTAPLCRQLRRAVPHAIDKIIVITVQEERGGICSVLGAGASEVLSVSELGQLRYSIASAEHRRGGYRCPPGRILYAESDPVQAELVQVLLTEAGHRVDYFPHGEEAWSAFRQNAYDLVITALVLAGACSGFSLVRQIRQLPGRAGEVPIMAASSLAEGQRKIELLESGVTDILTKPFHPYELVLRAGNLVTSRKLLDKVLEQQRQLRELAFTDQLTTLHNRHYLFDAAERFMCEARRTGRPVSLSVADVDFFKSINDRYGHAKGDEVLVAIGETLRRCCSENDVLVRFGGEEFILLNGNSDIRTAAGNAERLRREIERSRPGGLPVTMSFGVASLVPDRDDAFAVLFEAADQALYRAKQRGRNNVQWREVPVAME